jgi:hypothetical protein
MIALTTTTAYFTAPLFFWVTSPAPVADGSLTGRTWTRREGSPF